MGDTAGGGTLTDDNMVPLKEFVEAELDALEENFTQRLTGMDKAISIAMAGADKAVTKSEEAISARLALLNESKRTIDGIILNMMPRHEYSQGFQEHQRRIEAMELNISRYCGFAIGISCVATLIAVAEFIHSIAMLTKAG